MNLPIASTPSPSPVQQLAVGKPPKHPASSALPAAPDKAIARPGESSIASPSDDGRDDLLRARQYLAGEGLPKNSWMASQLLWQAIGKQNSEAVLLLSDLYARGDGVPRSCEQARILLVSAAKKGSLAAAQKLRSIETNCR
jgi:TPR repeat protein